MTDIAYLFCIYSALGWLVEVVFFYLKTGKYCKRGVLNGAYCPLYGFSLAVITVMSDDLSGSIAALFVVSAVVCTVFELLTGVIFDKLLARKMWDYSDRVLNIGGYVCLQFTVIWGVIATACVKMLNPMLLASGTPADSAMRAVLATSVIIFMICDLFTFVKVK